MPIQLPPGYLTRPLAAKSYNRSQRALERELDPALAQRDEKVLVHWKLVTKHGEVHDGVDVTLDFVKQLVNDGMAPAWCVEESWLLSKYGLRGEPRPTLTEIEPSPRIPEPTSFPDSTPPASGASQGLLTHLQKEVEFLKERIRNLEREKRDQIERSERRAENFIAQLNVKDEQIKKWDDIVQGLTRALATGRITPSLAAAFENEREQRRHDEAPDVVDVAASKSSFTSKQGTKVSVQQVASTGTKKGSKRKGNSERAAPSTESDLPAEHSFFSKSLPTFAKFLRRNRKR